MISWNVDQRKGACGVGVVVRYCSAQSENEVSSSVCRINGNVYKWLSKSLDIYIFSEQNWQKNPYVANIACTIIVAQMHAVCARAHPQHSIATIMLLSIYFILEPLNFKLTSIKNNEIEGRSRDGRAKKYTNKICRDNHVHYTSQRLLFSIMATICLLTMIHWCYR